METRPWVQDCIESCLIPLRALTFHEEHGAIVSITKSLQQREWLGETNLTFWCIRANIHDENTSRFSLNDDLKLRKKNS